MALGVPILKHFRVSLLTLLILSGVLFPVDSWLTWMMLPFQNVQGTAVQSIVTELQIRMGNRNNSGTIFLIFPLKHTVKPVFRGHPRGHTKTGCLRQVTP